MSIYYVIYLLLQCRSSIYCIIYQRHEQSCTTPCLQVWGCKHLTTLAVVMCKLFHGSLKASCHHHVMMMRWTFKLSTSQLTSFQSRQSLCYTRVCSPVTHQTLQSTQNLDVVMSTTWGPNSYLGNLGVWEPWEVEIHEKVKKTRKCQISGLHRQKFRFFDFLGSGSLGRPKKLIFGHYGQF